MTLSQAKSRLPHLWLLQDSCSLAEVCQHTEDGDGLNERSYFTETLRHWQADMIMGGKRLSESSQTV